MKITINKSAKRVLSLVLAFAVLIGSLFVANAGVTFSANAETTVMITDTWDGTQATGFAGGTGNSSDPYIIETAEQLAYAILSKTFLNSDNYFMVKANSVFDMNGMQGIGLNSSIDDVKSSAVNSDCNWTVNIKSFSGHFNGNGVVIYNLYSSGSYSGLFPYIDADNTAMTSSVKNITIKNSRIVGQHFAGGIIGNTYVTNGQRNLNIENCAVENCYITDNNATGYNRTVGGIIASASHAKTTINNCLVISNDIAGGNLQSAFVANTSGYSGGISINNSISIGILPYTVASANNTQTLHPTAIATGSFNDVYTDKTASSTYTGIKTLTTTQMTGTSATENMSLDFKGTWFANTAGVPELRISHNISGKNNGDGTHSEFCADAGCDLIGLTTNHLYNNVDYINNTTSCICGVSVPGTIDVWDGTMATAFDSGSGSEDDPYIIKTVEQLFRMVRSDGLNADGKPIYYKVADSVNALYINDTRGFADQDAFEAAASSLKNWSIGLTKESDFCGNTANCVCSNGQAGVHKDGYVDSFAGRFDGNGVVIYGLYSKTTVTNHWNNGTGFVPMLTGDAVIKNVVFDTNYIDANSASAAVVTSSVGVWIEQYRKEIDGVQTVCMCPKVSNKISSGDKCNAAIINVAVRNSYIKATSYTDWNSKVNSCVSGFVSSIRAPKSVKLTNCLFDGTDSTLIDNVDSTVSSTSGTVAVSRKKVFAATFDDVSNIYVDGCVNITGDSDVNDLVSCESNGDHIFVWKCYSLTRDSFNIANAPLLNWTAWNMSEATLEKFDTPIPNIATGWAADGYFYDAGHYISYYKNLAMGTRFEHEYTSSDSPAYYPGLTYVDEGYQDGVFHDYDNLFGSGSEEDPYIINDAVTLYQIIASGGTHRGVPQHYKLGCNIDLCGMQWVDTVDFIHSSNGNVFYKYIPFAGTLDGDGHTISNMYSARGAESAGFIPYLASSGVVKNINFRNCYAYSEEEVAIIAGSSDDGATIENCSIESNEAVDYFVSEEWIAYYTFGDASVNDCYVIKADNSVEYSGESPTLDGINWYGIEGGVARRISFAKSQPCADIDADGIGEEYTTNDAIALKNYLLWKDGYDFIYGDVNFDGKTNMRDLAALQREMSDKNNYTELDGFWNNAKVGKFTIYYNDSDYYDFARKLELYIENATGVDIEKTNNGDASNFAIKLVTGGEANTWSYNYEPETAVLTFTGANFTAVEEAVDHFIANVSLFGQPKGASGTLDEEKNAVDLDGDGIAEYFYAWGDEFNSDINDTVSYDKWILRNKGTDKTLADNDEDNDYITEFAGIRQANDEEARNINQIIYDESTDNGKLVLKRGILDNVDSDGYKYYASGISTKNSMLFKEGYMEMQATLPADGYAFPAWWLLTHATGGNSNVVIDKSLYSKVYKKNDDFNGSAAFNGNNYKTYQYKLPTQTLEMDLFEIIQYPNHIYGKYFSKSSDNKVKFNVHKWYTHSRFIDEQKDANDNKTGYADLYVYNLNWENIPTSGSFDKLLIGKRTSADADFSVTSSNIAYHTSNIKDGSINIAVGESGTYNTSISLNNAKTHLNEYRYGFLWTADKMVFMVGSTTDEKMTEVATITKDDLVKSGDSTIPDANFGFDQYAYMLIENHMFTAEQGGSDGNYKNDLGDCKMTIDYVRLYQLDGARNIITPESESIHDR